MLHEIESSNEEDEVFEARVQVVFCAQTHDVLEVSVINMSIHSE